MSKTRHFHPTPLHPKSPHSPPPGFAWLLRSGDLAAMCSAMQRGWDPPNASHRAPPGSVMCSSSGFVPHPSSSHMMWRSTRKVRSSPCSFHRHHGRQAASTPRGLRPWSGGKPPPGLTSNHLILRWLGLVTWVCFANGLRPLLRSQVSVRNGVLTGYALTPFLMWRSECRIGSLREQVPFAIHPPFFTGLMVFYGFILIFL